MNLNTKNEPLGPNRCKHTINQSVLASLLKLLPTYHLCYTLDKSPPSLLMFVLVAFEKKNWTDGSIGKYQSEEFSSMVSG